jgi:hypothetical protein
MVVARRGPAALVVARLDPTTMVVARRGPAALVVAQLGPAAVVVNDHGGSRHPHRDALAKEALPRRPNAAGIAAAVTKAPKVSCRFIMFPPRGTDCCHEAPNQVWSAIAH